MVHVRSLVPDMWILAPGIGAQGGDLEKTVHAGVRRTDRSGLLVNVSRGISRAADPAAAARKFRDDINAARQSTPAAGGEAPLLKAYQTEFIQLALKHQVLRFGDFTLKSGRKSPYFFNAGNFKTGGALAKVGEFYASAIKNSGVEFDVLFGPAYKGIPLAAATSIAMFSMYGDDVPYTFNRKEAKDHGEGGTLVGAPVKGQRVLILDDVISAGTAIRETMTLLNASEAIAAGVVIALDRQEQTGGDAAVRISAIQGVEKEFGIPVTSVVKLDELIGYLAQQDDCQHQLEAVSEYRLQYGV
jgi:orotate phosphoribosyltransferase